jgi:hypothetical protein
MNASPLPQFSVEVDQNEYLPDGASVVDAVVTITATGSGPARGAEPSAAQVIMVDCSGSMAHPATKMAEAKKATVAAIDSLRDGVSFAVVSGTAYARMIYPTTQVMVPASARTRAEAKALVAQVRPEGGTAIGKWLELANWLFAGANAEVKHAILLTDGRNQHETAEELQRILDVCDGKFVCDSRGVGTDWVATELRKVASTLLGTADGLKEAALLPAEFQAMTEAAMGKAVADVTLRVWSPAGATVRFVKQVFPQIEDLTARRTAVSARVGDYPTGAWGGESRDYHVSVEVSAGGVGDELLAARVSVVSRDKVLGERLVLAKWTDDTALATTINPRVAHYTGQAELASAIQEGLAARDAGEVEVATAKLGRAVRLATESGHEDTAKLLARVVDVVDADNGTVVLKKKVEGVDAEIANVRSVKTIRTKPS